MLLRTGSALLHLKALIDDKNEDTIIPFRTKTVEISWDRVKSINIVYDHLPLVVRQFRFRSLYVFKRCAVANAVCGIGSLHLNKILIRPEMKNGF